VLYFFIGPSNLQEKRGFIYQLQFKGARQQTKDKHHRRADMAMAITICTDKGEIAYMDPEVLQT
jgi:hypothetical protein